MIRRILKYIGEILIVLAGLLITFIIIEGFFISYRFWFYRPQYSITHTIINHRNSCRIENPVFRHNPNPRKEYNIFGNQGEIWLVKMNDKWYEAHDDYSLDSTLIANGLTDSTMAYTFKPKYHRTNFSLVFKYLNADIISGHDDPGAPVDVPSGIFELQTLYLERSVRNLIHGRHPPVTKFELKLINIRHNIRFMYDDIKRFFEHIFTKSSSDLLDQYVTSDLIHIRHPLIYIPFPLDKGYIFEGDVLKIFNWVTEYVHDQNFYAVLAEIPSDIKRLGKVIACDENGVLLSLDRSKTPIMRVRLKRLKEDELFYASFFKYKKKHLRKMISEEEYQIIDAYDKTAINSYEMYDKRIFVNMRKMLSELDYEEVSNQCGWE